MATKTKTTKPDELAIPAFLLRSNGKAAPSKKKAANPKAMKEGLAKAPAAPAKTRLELIDDEAFRTHVTKEIKVGRFQEKWLADPSTLVVMEKEFNSKRPTPKATPEAPKPKAPKEAPKPKAAQPPRIAKSFPEDDKLIVSFEKVNPRKEGTTNHDRYEKFKAYMAKNKEATVKEVVTNSGLYRGDLMHEVKVGRVKLSGATVKETPAAKKEKAGLPPIKAAVGKKAPAAKKKEKA